VTNGSSGGLLTATLDIATCVDGVVIRDSANRLMVVTFDVDAPMGGILL
jgi:hypothetical protein